MMADDFVMTRLAAIKGSFEELTAKLADPELMANTDELLRVSKERSKLEETVEAYDEHVSLTAELEEAREMFADSSDDAEMREMAREEVRGLEQRLVQLDEKLKLLLLPKDPNDEKNVMFEIRAGTGGDEAGIWAADLLKLYSKYCDGQGWRTRIVSRAETEVGGCREVTLEIQGDSVYSKLKFEAGPHMATPTPCTVH